MMADFTMKRNDTAPAIEIQLLDNEGAAVPIDGASSVRFHMKPAAGGDPVVDADAVVVDATTGIVKYSWLTADTLAKGSYLAEWEITFADGKIETFPNDRYITVSIIGDLA